MKKVIIIVFCLWSFLLVSCNNNDSHLSAEIFTKYEEELENLGFEFFEINTDNNVTEMFEISAEDVVAVQRAVHETNSNFAYFYVFPTIKKAEKKYEKTKEIADQTSNYFVYLDGHYLIIVKGYNFKDIIEDLNS